MEVNMSENPCETQKKSDKEHFFVILHITHCQ